MTENPLILVFYVDREYFKAPQLIDEFAKGVDAMFEKKKMNAVAYFIPTDTEERIECINPAIVPADEMDRINKIVKDIQDNFGLTKLTEE